MHCECEHADHFQSESERPPDSHPYGDTRVLATGQAKTLYGTYALCDRCFTAQHMHLTIDTEWRRL